MNKKIMFLAVVVVVLSTVFFSCASAPRENIQAVDAVSLTVNAAEDESILVIQRRRIFAAAAIPMRIWMNGTELPYRIGSGQEIQIVIPNGEHTIQAGSSNVDRGNEITFFIDNNMILFFAQPAAGFLTRQTHE